MKTHDYIRILPNELWRMVLAKIVDHCPKQGWNSLCSLEDDGLSEMINSTGIKDYYMKKHTKRWVVKCWKLIKESSRSSILTLRHLISCGIDALNIIVDKHVIINDFDDKRKGYWRMVGPFNQRSITVIDENSSTSTKLPVLMFVWLGRAVQDIVQRDNWTQRTVSVTRFVGLYIGDDGYNWIPIYPRLLETRKKLLARSMKPALMYEPVSDFGIKSELFHASQPEQERYLNYHVDSTTFKTHRTLEEIVKLLAEGQDTYTFDFCCMP